MSNKPDITLDALEVRLIEPYDTVKLDDGRIGCVLHVYKNRDIALVEFDGAYELQQQSDDAFAGTEDVRFCAIAEVVKHKYISLKQAV